MHEVKKSVILMQQLDPTGKKDVVHCTVAGVIVRCAYAAEYSARCTCAVAKRRICDLIRMFATVGRVVYSTA